MPTLIEAKNHLRIDHDDDDLAITAYLDAAIAWLAVTGCDVSPSTLAKPVAQASLMMTAHFYERREAADDARLAPLPLGVLDLIAPYRLVKV